MTDNDQRAFCTACGTVLGPEDRFCASCGAPSEPGAAASGNAEPRVDVGARGDAPTGAPRAAASLTPAAGAVFALLLAVGAAMVVYHGGDEKPPPRAVPGAPTAQGGAPTQTSGALPPAHPTIELPDEAKAFLEELATATEENPEDVAAWEKLAQARYRASLLDRSYAAKASAALDKLLALDANNLVGIRTAGNVAYDGGSYVEAEKLFTRYLELDADEASVLTDLGSVQLFQSRPEDAAATYRKAIALAPDFVQAHFNLGIALKQQGQDDAAMAAFKRARDEAEDPRQIERIDAAIAAAEGRPPSGLPEGHPPVDGDAVAGAASGSPGSPKPGSTPTGATPSSNAEGAFQSQAEQLLTGHRIVGPRVASFAWSGPASARVELRDFPMDKMPPVMRNKFKSGMNEKLAALAGEHGVDAPVELALVDAASGAVMDRLDAKEWVGAFDDPYEE